MSPDHRIILADRKPVVAPPDLEAVFIGAAAAATDPDAATEAVAEAARLGFQLQPGNTGLTNMPLAFASTGAFAAAFPGDDSWLAWAVRDYFNAGGPRAWVVRMAIDPAAPLDAYFRSSAFAVRARTPSGIEVAMQVPNAGLVLLPDLEEQCVVTVVASAPVLPSLPPPAPGFRPINDFVAPSPPRIPQRVVPPVPVAPNQVLASVNIALRNQRPDMLCLFALPVGADESLSATTLLQRASIYLYSDGSGPDLPNVQAFAPLVRGQDGTVASPSGMIAGVMAGSAQTDGVWRSIAGRALPLGYTPLRRIESAALDRMRRNGIATLRYAGGGTVLDDDILAIRFGPGSTARGAAGTRRLMGWLLRNLRRFGEQLVFENVLDEGLVELVLADLFNTLLRRGALNGRQLTDAVRVTRRKAADAAVQFDIAVNTAFALETIQLRFLDGELSTSLGAAP